MSDPATEANEPGEGTVLGRYRLKHRLAEGGMASVYLAQLEGPGGFQRWVAVKVVHRDVAADERFATMLLDEARMAARLHHPNICAVTDFGAKDGLLYLVMEYLHGETMAAAICRGIAEEKMFPAWLSARVVADVARGLHSAHELRDPDGHSLGMVHRDVSPQNVVILYDGVSKILDFGIARARGRMTVTRAGEVKGKLAYIAPEQLRPNQHVDRRADVWSLGVVLWEATVGRRLFRGDSHSETVQRVVQAEIPRPSDLVSGYPEELEAIIMGALQRDVNRRTETAKRVADALESYLTSLGTTAGHAQVSRWMDKQFSDRLAVREALLSTDDPVDQGDFAIRDLQSELSLGSHMLSDSHVRSASFAAPSEATQLSSPQPRAGSPSNPDAVSGVARQIEEERIRDIERATRRLRRRPKWPFALAGFGVLCLAGGGYLVAVSLGAVAAPSFITAATRTPQAAEAPEPTGTLSLTSEPAATVLRSDGTIVGTTPLDALPMPVGTHELTLEPAEGGTPSTTRVTIRDGRDTSVRIVLRR